VSCIDPPYDDERLAPDASVIHDLPSALFDAPLSPAATRARVMLMAGMAESARPDGGEVG
jgi:hypothetical protein